jgi:hypothetical protein
MRIRHSLKAFVPFILMLAAGRNVQAQYGPPPSDGMYAQNFGVYQPQSPYQNVFDQTYVSDGLWFNRAVQGLDAQRDWYFDLRYVRSNTRKLRGIVGAEGVQTYTQQNDPAADGLADGLSFYNTFDPATGDMIPRMKAHGIQWGGGFWNADGSGLMLSGIFTPEQTETYDARARIEALRLEAFRALSLQAGGGRVPLPGANPGGRTDLDILKNEILAPGTTFDATDAISYGFNGSTFDVLDRALMNLHGLPLLHGTPIVPVDPLDPRLDRGELNGTTVPYDMEFIMKHSISVIGGSADWAFTPMYERSGFTVRPVVGGRYQKLTETFDLFGQGSFLAWGDADGDAPLNVKVPTPADGIDQDGDFIVDNINEGSGGAGAGTGNFDLPVRRPTETDLYATTTLMSQVKSHLAGPQFGLQYEIGDRGGLQLLGASRFGLMFNTERIRIGGDNVVDFMGRERTIDPLTGQEVELRGFDTGTGLNAFRDSTSSTHLSPLFEQGLNAQIPIFRGIPVLKDMWQFEDAKLNLGVSVLWIGEVADPNQSVLYQSSPVDNVFPTITPDRSSFYQTNFNIGVNWSY